MPDKNSAISYIHLFQCQKAFLERMELFGFGRDCIHEKSCIADNVHKLYKDAMSEAIRCIKIVNGLEAQDEGL